MLNIMIIYTFTYSGNVSQRYFIPEREESNYIEPEPSHNQPSPPADHSHTPAPARKHSLDRNEIISTEQMCKSFNPHSHTCNSYSVTLTLLTLLLCNVLTWLLQRNNYDVE